MKTVDLTPTETNFFLPVAHILAAYNGVSNREARYYLEGVYVERQIDSSVVTVSTDGKILIRQFAPDGAHMGAACATQSTDHDSGFLLKLDTTEKALKAKASDLWVKGDTETGILEAFDKDHKGEGNPPRLGVCEFSTIDGTFPDYRRLLLLSEGGTSQVPVSICPHLTTRLIKTGTVFAKDFTMRYDAKAEGDPIRVTFSGADHMLALIMPKRF